MRFYKKRLFFYVFISIFMLSIFILFLSSSVNVEAQSSCSQACSLGQICRSGSCVDICSDGTPVGSCSVRKPLFCNLDQRLANNIAQCGCPVGKVSLPSGYCGIVINDTSFLSDHFEAGYLENLDLIPLRAGLPNLASGANINLVGFLCPNPGLRLTSPPNPDDLNGQVIDFTDVYGTNGEKVLVDGSVAPLYLTSATLISGYGSLDGRQILYPKQSELCYIPNNASSPYIQLDLGSKKAFSEVQLSFSTPFITDYQILYSNDNGNNKNWNVAYSGHDEFSLKNSYTDHWSFGAFGLNDENLTKVHRNFKTGKIISIQSKIGGINYQTYQVSHSFNTVSGRYIRFVPKNWYERAGLYEIGLYNPDSQMQLKTRWDSVAEQTKYLSEGSYESPVLFANVSPADLSYKKISWNLGSNKFVDKTVKSNSGVQIPSDWFLEQDTDYLRYTVTHSSPGWPTKNDLSFRFYGYGGSPNAGAVPLSLSNQPTNYYGGPSANNPGLDTSQGVGKSSLSLDGIDDYAFTTADPLLRLENNFTISAWVKPENGGSVLSKGTGNDVTTDYSLAVTTFGTQGQIAFFVRGQLYQTPAINGIDNGWHHVIVTYEKPGMLVFYLDNLEVYRNNNVQGEYARVGYNNPYYQYNLPTNIWSDSFLVGAHGRSGVTPFKGKIDEIMIYDRSLSLSEIQQIRDLQFSKLNVAGAVGNLPNNLNKLLLAYWDFSSSLPASSYVSFQYVDTDTLNRWNNGNKIPNRVSPQYSQILSGSYPEAGYANIAYGGPKCLFDDKLAGELTTSEGIPSPGQPCVYHPAEAAFHKPLYEGNASWASDSSGYRLYLGALFGVNITSDSVRGNALILDGVDDYLSIPMPAGYLDVNGDVNHLNIGNGDFSGSVWIKDPSVQWSGVFSKGRGNPGFAGNLSGAYDLFVSRNGDSAVVAFRIIDTNKKSWIVETSYSDASQWHHISFTLNRASNQMKIYVDGEEKSSIEGLPAGDLKTNYPFIIGAQQFEQDMYPMHTNYKGKIDELRLYGRMLSVSEIQQLSREKNIPVPSSVDVGLKGHWKFDEENYNYFPKTISVAHEVAFGIPAGLSVDRITVSELQDRISKIDFRGFAQLYKEPTGAYDTTSVFDLPAKHTSTGSQWYRILLYSRIVPGLHERNPIVWEIGLLETQDVVDLSSVDFDDLHVKFQFRSGDSENEAKSAGWTGPDGTANSFYSTSGQNINSMHNGNSYYQYRFIASTDDDSYTPVVDNISISYGGRINQAPRAHIKNPGKIFTNADALFDASLSRDDGLISKYEWDFGDGNTFSGTTNEAKIKSHRYFSPGEYTVHLTVYDSAGFSGETYLTVQVEPFDCMTPEPIGSADNDVFGTAIAGDNVIDIKDTALREYSENHNLPDITYINTAEEYMDAALEYLEEHMSYLTPRAECFQSHGGLPRWPVSLDRISTVTPQCGCPEGADFCGNCMDFSVAFTTLVRAMGVNSKCVYSGVTEPGLPFQTQGTHAYNVILYKGKYRIVEPQGNSLTSNFELSKLEWSNGEVPYYLTGLILNDQVGLYGQQYNQPSSPAGLSRQNLVASKISNYPGSTGLPDSGRRCVEKGYLNLSTEAQRLAFVAQQMYLLTYIYNSTEYEAAPDKCTYSVNFNLRKILGRPPTTSEIGRFENCTSTGNGIRWNDYNRYMSETDFKNTFKQSFTLFATAANGDFMAINENLFLEKLYAYLMGFPITDTITDTVTENKEYLAKRWHIDTKYSFYRSFYSSYDPLEVFEDVCP